MGLKKNNPGCGCCDETCDVCDETNGSNIGTGFYFVISGWGNLAGSDCDCTDHDGTYYVPATDYNVLLSVGVGEGCKGVAVFDCCDAGGGAYQWIELEWWVWKYTTSPDTLGLALYIRIYEHSDTCHGGTPTEKLYTIYDHLGWTDDCDALSGESMVWRFGAGSYSDPDGCDNYDSLSVTAYAY